jgi:hypothetical protein
MGPILVNTKQKVAVLATGLAIAASGFVVPVATAASGSDDSTDPVHVQQQASDR